MSDLIQPNTLLGQFERIGSVIHEDGKHEVFLRFFFHIIINNDINFLWIDAAYILRDLNEYKK